MKGVTKPVKLNVEYSGVTKDHWGGERAGFVIAGKINRTDWGINFNTLLETGGVMVSEDVKINSEIQLVKQAVLDAAYIVTIRETKKLKLVEEFAAIYKALITYF